MFSLFFPGFVYFGRVPNPPNHKRNRYQGTNLPGDQLQRFQPEMLSPCWAQELEAEARGPRNWAAATSCSVVLSGGKPKGHAKETHEGGILCSWSHPKPVFSWFLLVGKPGWANEGVALWLPNSRLAVSVADENAGEGQTNKWGYGGSWDMRGFPWHHFPYQTSSRCI